MTDKLSPLEQSLADDIAAEQAQAAQQAEEKTTAKVAEEVVEKVETTEETNEQEETETVESAEDIEEDDLPANPTNKDFAKMRKALKDKEKELELARIAAAQRDGYLAGKNEATPKAEAKQEVDQEPDFDTDPKAWILWRDKIREREHNALKQTTEQMQLRNNLQKVIDTAKNEEADYAKARPEYGESKAYLKNLVMDGLRRQNPLASPAELDALVMQEEYKAILQAKTLGLNPAIYFNGLAEQAGFKPTGIKTEKAKTGPNIEAMKRNKEKSISLVGTQTNASGLGEPTDEEIADMTLSQLAALGKK